MKYSFIISFIICTHILINLKTQTGYIHPDEFFQTIEISGGSVLNYSIFTPWEYSAEYPIRSQAVLELYLNIPLKLYVNICELLSVSHDILTFSRIWMSFLSLINICSIFVLSSNRQLSLILYASSYIPIVFLNRSFSNCWETQLLSLFIILHSRKPTRKLQFVEGLIVSLGLFCRPTFLLFVAPFILLTIYRLDYYKIGKYAFNSSLGFLCLSVCLISIDTLKYRGQTLLFGGGFLSDCLIFARNAVIVPVNFFLYNIRPDNLKSHGEHPRMTHFLVNLPLLLGPLFLVLIASITHLRLSISNQRLALSIAIPTACLSLLPHQEMRFLLPLFPASIALVANTLSEYSSKNGGILVKTILIAHLLFSVSLATFWGYLHEGGLLPASKVVLRDIQASPPLSRHLIVSYKTLLLPKFLFEVDRVNASRFDVVNLMGIDEETFFERLERIKAEDGPRHTILHLMYPRAHIFRDYGRLASLGAARASVIVRGHINTDLWDSRASLEDFLSLQYLSFSL